MTSENRRDRVVNDAAEQAGYARLLELFTIVDEQSERFDAITVHDTSSLAVERRLAPRHPLQYRVQVYVGVTTDHLNTLSLVLKEGLPMVGCYPIVRAAIEASALGVWALKPGNRNKRILRTLLMDWHESGKTADLAKKVGREPAVDLARIRRRLDQIKDERSALRGSSLDRSDPAMTDILKDVERHTVHAHRWGPLVAWTICAGMAHGNQSMQQQVLERRYLGDSDGIGASWRLTSSFAVLADLVEPAVELLTQLIDAFEVQAQPDRSRRHAGKGA